MFKGFEKHDFRTFKVCTTQVKDIKEYGKTLIAAQHKVFFDKAQQYTQGILQSHRCNIEERRALARKINRLGFTAAVSKRY